MNVGANTHIEGLENTFCKRSHIAHCLAARDMHEIVMYTYFGKHVQRGIVKLHTKNGDFLAVFRCEDGWLKELFFG